MLAAQDASAKASKGRHMTEHKVKGGTAGLVPGTKAPDFALPRDGGGTVALADFAGKKLVLYFYPRADTSGCTREAIDFSRHKAAFARAGADILGVSADPVAAQDAFKAKHKLAVALASTKSTACSRPTACGRKNRCTAESSSASCARPS
jgi:thioredoxin-dependent peroxiredoxin